MTNEELLACATAFDMGPQPFLNGHVRWWEKFPWDSRRYRITIRKTGNPDPDGPDRWGIFQDSDSCLAKTGYFVYQSMPSSRTDTFYKRCRYDTLEEAIAYYKAWEAAVLAWADKQPEGTIFEFHKVPARLIRYTVLMKGKA